MKKMIAILVAAMIALSCTFAAAAVYPSPTAPTIIPPNPDQPPTGEHPTAPTSPSNTNPTATNPSDTTGTSVTKPTTGTTGTSGTSGTGVSTTPDGSTVTGTAKPDTNPDSPKTGDTGMEVFVFSAIAMTGACTLVLLRKKKDDEQ